MEAPEIIYPLYSEDVRFSTTGSVFRYPFRSSSRVRCFFEGRGKAILNHKKTPPVFPW
jgi:hypothetical protein